MRGANHWQFTPYSRLDDMEKRKLPYICRLAPIEHEVTVEWLDPAGTESFTVSCRERGGQAVCEKTFSICEAIITGLTPGRDYEIFIRRNSDGACSDTRLFRTGAVPGTIVNYLHPEDNAYDFSGHFLCSPSIVKLPSGALLSSMDIFGRGTPQNLSLLYRSDDGGQTWKYTTELFPCFWGKLFVHRDVLYMFAVSTEHGDLVIGRSEDEGKTWTAPVHILPGSGRNIEKGLHKGPMPVISHRGRLWTGVDYGAWRCGGYANGLLSIDENDDLLQPENWCCTGFLKHDPAWPGAAVGDKPGCLEGNAVAAPDGRVVNFLRYQIKTCEPAYGRAVILQADEKRPEQPLQLDRIIDFNGALSKFTVLKDEQSGKYVSLVNRTVHPEYPGARNVQSLVWSADLYHWQQGPDILNYDHCSPAEVAFQYVDFIIDGEDILFVSRTALNNAASFHDSNYTTFHRIKNFRQYM